MNKKKNNVGTMAEISGDMATWPFHKEGRRAAMKRSTFAACRGEGEVKGEEAVSD